MRQSYITEEADCNLLLDSFQVAIHIPRCIIPEKDKCIGSIIVETFNVLNKIRVDVDEIP